MGQMAFYVDTEVCSGCKTCQVACQEAHDLPAEVLWRRVYHYGGGSWEKGENGIYKPEGIFRYFVSVSCNHCGVPACVEACPTGAMTKDEETGIVTSDPEVCIGCETCVQSCPYEAPRLNSETGKISKCDCCKTLLDAGEEPACVQACPQRALEFGELSELKKKYPDALDGIEPLPKGETGPALLLHPHKDAQISGEGTGRSLCTEDER